MISFPDHEHRPKSALPNRSPIREALGSAGFSLSRAVRRQVLLGGLSRAAKWQSRTSLAGLGVFVAILLVTNPRLPVVRAALQDESGDTDKGKPVNELPESCLATGPWPSRPLVNWSFGAGESLTYSIGWEKVTAGYGTMTVGEPVDTFGRLCYPIVSTVRSTPFVSTFFKVDDRVETIMDVRELFPLYFEKRLQEGSFRSARRIRFDPGTGLGLTPTDTFPVPRYVLDDLSLLYHVRSMELVPGRDVELDIYSGKKLYHLTVKIIKKERIKVEAGVFNTIVVEPLLQAAGLFKSEGKVTVWLTDDRLHLPVLMKSKVVVGSIVAELEDFKLGQLRRY